MTSPYRVSMKSLKDVYEVLETLASNRSRKFKEQQIESAIQFLGEKFKLVLLYALDPYKQYNTTQVPEMFGGFSKPAKSVNEIFSYLDEMAERRGATSASVAKLGQLSSIDKETLEVVRRIVNKDLRCGVSVKTVKKFLDIPEHEVMLCKWKYNPITKGNIVVDKGDTTDIDKFVKHCGGWGNIIGSTKKDGIRTWAYPRDDGTYDYISRNGKPLNNFHVFDKILNTYFYDLGVIDAEVTAEGFQKLMTQVQRLGEIDPKNFRMEIIDIPEWKGTQEQRIEVLQITQRLMFEDEQKKVSFIPHYELDDFEFMLDMYQHLLMQKEEGMVIKNANAEYELKRSKDWMKVVPVRPVDLKVIKAVAGTGKYSNTLGYLLCEFKDGTVKVGSGFSDDERDRFFDNPPEMIEVHYREETDNGKSLRFPTYFRVREDK